MTHSIFSRKAYLPVLFSLTLFVSLLSPLAGQAIGKNSAALTAPYFSSPTHASLLAQAQPDTPDADRLMQQALIQLNEERFQEAAQSYEQAIALYRNSSRDDRAEQIAEAELGFAKATLLLKDYPKAVLLWEKQVAQERPSVSALSLSNLGLAYFSVGRYAEAETTLREAIARWEWLRAKYGDGDTAKITYFEQHAHTYRLLQKVLVAQNRPEAALEVAELSRARALAELLAQRSIAQSAKPLNLNQIKQIAKAENSTLVEYSLIGSEVRVLGIEPDEETDLFIWVIPPNGNITFRQVKLPTTSLQPLSELVLKTREEGIGVRGRGVANRKGNTVDPPLPELKQLYQWLIEPIRDRLPTDSTARITFIPQGSLFLTPFAALQNPAGTYLIQEHTPLVAPSIQVLELTQHLNSKSTGAAPLSSALVVGNPTMPSLPPAPGEPPEPLASLPGAEREAKAIATLLNTKPLIGAQATKAAVIQQLPQKQIIHLATHGLLDLDSNLNEFGIPLDPNVRTARQGGVFMTPGAILIGKNVFINGVPAEQALAREKVVLVDPPGAIALAPSGQDNGFLTTKEILQMQLQADLVVLSACDTGRGRVTGDGVVGLSRAFIAAGVPSVIVSLWAVPDAPTSSLMVEFYQNLTRMDKAQALRQAMLTTLKQYPETRDWAAFTLIGEP
ncbi:MAG: CHAT domain-containing protein [Scytolyngbya sp. HA4215-MV1]|jgi:CHAT domain-containing protein|nr:CHAT domain-containing protein [Scytolyngbya sp. HA4215-MV1]